ncbi:MAG: ASCH domain-containing protein [Bacilli bacterium]|nr:ASCH domain-containing protein [Bacilli bacterium]
MDLTNVKTWNFGIDNDNLVRLVLSGDKRATTSLFNSYVDEPLPKIGDLGILVYSDNKKACITKITDVIITEFKNIDSTLAKLEGEGDKSLEYYRKVHNDFFKEFFPDFNDDTLVVFEIFEVVEKLS